MAINKVKFIKDYAFAVSGENLNSLNLVVDIFNKYKVEEYNKFFQSDIFKEITKFEPLPTCAVYYVYELIKDKLEGLTDYVIVENNTFKLDDYVFEDKDRAKVCFAIIKHLLKSDDIILKMVMKELKSYALNKNSNLKNVKC